MPLASILDAVPPEGRRPCADDIVITIPRFPPRSAHYSNVPAQGMALRPARTTCQDTVGVCTPVLLPPHAHDARADSYVPSQSPRTGVATRTIESCTPTGITLPVSRNPQAYDAVPCLSYLCSNFISMPISRRPCPQSIHRRPFGLSTYDLGPSPAGLRTASSPRPIHRPPLLQLPASPEARHEASLSRKRTRRLCLKLRRR